MMTDKCPYCGEPYKQRSQQSHAHEFAWLHDAWLNLPEHLADLYPSPDHLRKRALIEAGWYDETITDVGSKAGALRVASMLRRKDDFALVIVRGQYVIERTAKSQSRRAMNKDEFQRSKTAIMECIAALIGATANELSNATAASILAAANGALASRTTRPLGYGSASLRASISRRNHERRPEPQPAA